ncbi:MAG: T9SS C-terminal target domain-containing protein [Cytophagales bacterium]|nr:MAG: T9SS C-terminal target domain-containing protein [Cytophagales bacterium]
MIKKLTITMALFAFNFSFSWDYIGQKGTGNGGDFEIASNNDIYVAEYDAGLSGSNILLKVKKYNGISWENLPNASEGVTISTTVDIEINGSNIYVGYAEFKNSAYHIVVKKFENNAWVSVATSITSSNFFDLLVDSDDVCYVLAKGRLSLDNSVIYKLSNNTWISNTIANSAGVPFQDKSAFIDSNKDLIFPMAKVAFRNGALVYDIIVQKLSGTSFTGVGNTVSTSNGGVYTRLFLSENGNQKLITSSATTNTFYTLEAGNWVLNPITSTISASANADLDANEKWYFANGSKIFEEGNSTAIYESTGTIISDIKIYNGFVYALLNDGVIKQAVGGGVSRIASSKDSEIENLILYPNPATDKLYLKSNISSYSIFNNLGVLFEKNIVSGNEINVSKLENGVYFMQLFGKDKTVKLNFIKK